MITPAIEFSASLPFIYYYYTKYIIIIMVNLNMVHDCISTPIQIDLSTEDSGLSHLRPQLSDLKVVEDDRSEEK